MMSSSVSTTSISTKRNPRNLLLVSLLLTFAAPLPAATIYANDFGAKPDGTTPATAAIQKAIDTAASKHDTVSFRPGNYLT